LLLTLSQVQHSELEKVYNVISDKDVADALFKDQKLKGVMLYLNLIDTVKEVTYYIIVFIIYSCKELLID